MSEPLDPPDIEIIRGNNYPPAMWQFLISDDPDELPDLTGSIFKLEVIWPGGSILRSSDANPELAVDVANSILTWNYTAQQSRSLPLGMVARYEIERWTAGSQQSLIAGYFVASEGANPD